MSTKFNTLNDLGLYLENTPNSVIADVLPQADFLESQPSQLAKIDYIEERLDVPTKKTELSNQEFDFSVSQLAASLHQRAKQENKSFAELWLDVLEEGSKQEMIIPFDKALRTWSSVPARAAKIFAESMNSLLAPRV